MSEVCIAPVRLLVQCNRVAESEVDEILHQHSEYAASMIDKERDRFVKFVPVKSRVVILMHETMAGKDVQQVVERQNVACSFTWSSKLRSSSAG